MTRLLLTGDLHLGAGGEYGREPGDRLRDQQQVWTQILDLAAEREVDAVLFAGDAFHRRRPTPAELIAFQQPLQAFVAETGIEVCAITGNHDVEAADLPSALDVFGRDVDVYTRPGIWRAPGGLAVACLPWTPIARLVASQNGGDRDDLNDSAAELLLQTARGMRAEVDGPCVLMLHWSITGAKTPTGAATDDFREVVLPLGGLEELGFDAVIAGHIHLPARLNRLGAPVLYVGSPLPVDFGEADSSHGVWIYDNEEPLLEFVEIPSRRFLTIDFDHEDVFAQIALSHAIGWDVADAVVRIRYRATEEQARRVDHAAVKQALYDAGAHKVYAIVPEIVREQRARVQVEEDLAPMGALEMWMVAESVSDEFHRRSLRDLTALYLEAEGVA